MLEIATTTLDQLQRIAGPSSTLKETPRPPTNATSSLPPQSTKETPKPIEQDNSNPTFNDELLEFGHRLNYQFPRLTERQLKEAMGQLRAREIDHVVATLVWVAKGSQHGSSYDEIIGTKQDPIVGAWKDADFDVKQCEKSREDYD